MCPASLYDPLGYLAHGLDVLFVFLVGPDTKGVDDVGDVGLEVCLVQRYEHAVDKGVHGGVVIEAIEAEIHRAQGDGIQCEPGAV